MEEINDSYQTMDLLSDSPPGDEIKYVRRSVRNPAQALLQTSSVQKLLEKILANHLETVVLKVKDHLIADINSVVLDAIIAALHSNSVCQALYLQNLNKALKHPQLLSLIALLQHNSNIWCLNIGENYDISSDMWTHFCKNLPETNVTHLYVSEHVISVTLKNRMRYTLISHMMTSILIYSK
jgi:hypothetical protein